MPRRAEIASMQIVTNSSLEFNLDDIEELAVDQANGKLYSIDKDGKQIYLGNVTAMSITLKSGRTLYTGTPEAIFDLRCTDRDKIELSGMNIKVDNNG